MTTVRLLLLANALLLVAIAAAPPPTLALRHDHNADAPRTIRAGSWNVYYHALDDALGSAAIIETIDAADAAAPFDFFAVVEAQGDTPAGNWSAWSQRSAMLTRLASVTYQSEYEVLALMFEPSRWQLNYSTTGAFEAGRPFLLAQFLGTGAEKPIWVAAVHLNHYFLTPPNQPRSVDTVIPGAVLASAFAKAAAATGADIAKGSVIMFGDWNEFEVRLHTPIAARVLTEPCQRTRVYPPFPKVLDPNRRSPHCSTRSTITPSDISQWADFPEPYKTDAQHRMAPLWTDYFGGRMSDAVKPRTVSCCTKWAAKDRATRQEWTFEYDHIFFSDDLSVAGGSNAPPFLPYSYPGVSGACGDASCTGQDPPGNVTATAQGSWHRAVHATFASTASTASDRSLGSAGGVLGKGPLVAMQAVRKVGKCGSPTDFSCVQVQNISVPVPSFDEILIKTAGTGINPDELTLLRYPVLHYTLGIDVAGTVAAVGAGVKRFKVGDRVWAIGTRGAMAEYAIRPAPISGLLPAGIDLVAASTLPTVAMTSFGALRSAGAPWRRARNLTILITAGTGGTGYTAVQLAKAMGAQHIVTAASGPGIAFAKALGATTVVDYHVSSVYDAVADGSVDVVISNHKSNTTAGRAMGKLTTKGGVYVTLDGDTVAAADVPNGVTQVAYDLFDPSEAVRCQQYLDALGAMLENGTLIAHVEKTFGFDEAGSALAMEGQGHVLSKVAVVPLA